MFDITSGGTMANQILRERLNKELDALGMPSLEVERSRALSKLIKLPTFKAQVILSGVVVANDYSLDKIANELEVSKEWLLGKSNEKQAH
jgi:hydrogenase maturation factor HypF (carbamoyltransferase family)